MSKKIGVAFADFVSSEKNSRKHKNFEGKIRSTRDLFLIICFALIFFALFAKLFYLQIVQGSYFRDLSDSNRIRTVVVHAPRGVIFDRNDVPLVYNIPGFRKTENGKTTLLDKDEALSLLSKEEKNLEVDALRQYPYKDILAHVLGYIGQISKEELKNPQYADYKGGDLIGKIGVEKEYEANLKGIDEKQLVEVDSMGKIVRKLGQTDAVPGQNVKISIDINLQKAAYEAMKDVEKGAVIVSSPNGEILAMISKSSFDPNLFTLGASYKEASDSAYKSVSDVILDGVNQPLLNRAISGTYPPGSTFKLVVAAAGLDDSIIDENYQVEDTGVVRLGAFSFSNWFYTGYGRTDGLVNVVKGIKRSNDIFFYKLAEKIGVDKIAQKAEKIGLGNTLNIDLPGEAEGIVPSKKWKEKNIGEQWYLGDTYHYGIGQGYLLVTPLQVNAWTQIIANEGNFFRPTLIKPLNENSVRPVKEDLISSKSFSLIRQGMIESCSTGGVAWPLFQFKVKNEKLIVDDKNFLSVPESTSSANFKDYRGVSIACKTGTAQHGTEETLSHAWITLFAPSYDPQIIVTVLAEESGEGSNVAAPIAKKILEKYFSK